MGKIEAVIFDLEGVVVGTEHIWTNVDLDFLKKHGVAITTKEYQTNLKPLLVGLVIKDGTALIKTYYSLPEDATWLTEVRREMAKKLFENGVDFISGFVDFHNRIRKVYLTAVATGLERYFLDPLDEKLQLTERFGSHIHSSEDIGFISKPQPDIFFCAANELGIDPRNCLVIEDAPNGILGAKRAGMKCAALTTSFPKEKLMQADLVVDSYSEIDLNQF